MGVDTAGLAEIMFRNFTVELVKPEIIALHFDMQVFARYGFSAHYSALARAHGTGASQAFVDGFALIGKLDGAAVATTPVMLCHNPPRKQFGRILTVLLYRSKQKSIDTEKEVLPPGQVNQLL